MINFEFENMIGGESVIVILLEIKMLDFLIKFNLMCFGEYFGMFFFLCNCWFFLFN